MKQVSILDEIKKNKTFDVHPDEEQFVINAQKGGLSQDQIVKGLQVKRQDFNNGTFDQTGEVSTDQNSLVEKDVVDPATGQTTQGDVPLDPFGGRSKQQVLQMAFQSGITNASSLSEIAKTYDLVNGTEEQTPEQKKADNYTKAQQFISDNPGASREELQTAIKQYTTLDDGGITSLLNDSGAKKKEDMFTDDELKQDAIDVVKEHTQNIFSNKQKGLEDAIKAINDDSSYSPSEKEKVLQYIKDEYPDGRSFIDRLLPGGK